MNSKICAGLTALAFGLFYAGWAHAAELNWPDATNIVFADPAITLTIAASSGATDLAVNDSSVVVTVPAAGHFSISSGDRALLAAGGGAVTCNAGVSTVAVDPVGAPQTVTITAGAAACMGGSPGSVSHTSGSGTSPSAPAVPPTVVHPNGTLVLEGTTVYLIENSARAGFRDEQEYLSYGYSFAQVVPSSAADNALPFSDIKKAMEGTLVLDSSDNRTVYMIGLNGTKRGFVSEAVFKGLGYGFGNLPKINLSDYPAGAPIGSLTQAHPEGALVLDGKTIWWIRGGQRQGFESEAVFNTYGFSYARVVPSNAADLDLPAGPLVKFRDGTLALDGATYYIISDGKKLSFPSAEGLTVRGFKLSNVVSASLSSYESGGNVR